MQYCAVLVTVDGRLQEMRSAAAAAFQRERENAEALRRDIEAKAERRVVEAEAAKARAEQELGMYLVTALPAAGG